MVVAQASRAVARAPTVVVVWATRVVGAAVQAAAESYLDVNKDGATRIRRDGTPAEPDPQAEALIEEIDKQERDGGYH